MTFKNTGIKFATLLLALGFLLQTSCKKNDALTDNKPPELEPPITANDAVKVVATITGSVIDENNQPVANAAVTSGTYSATTDAMGNFSFRNINVSAANGNVTVVKTGYFKGIRSFVTDAGKNNYVKIQLIKQVLSGTISATAGGILSDNSATIFFPTNAFVTAAGVAYTGTVKVFAHWIDPTAANLALVMPGDLRGINATNGEFLLKSYGMVGAELQDNSGNPLKIAPGKVATITFPIPTSLQSTAPTNIPLWHFDEATARWKEEGTATKSGNTYTATVSKFSFWNVDVPANFVNLDLRLINSANSLPLANTMVKITSIVNNTSKYDFTNDSGYVSGYIPKNENLKLEVLASTACNTPTILLTQNIGPYTSNTSLGNISVTIPAANVINFTGTVQGCNNLPVSNGYISLTLANGTSTIAYTNATGLVNISLTHCGGTNIGYSYNAIDLSNGNYSSTISGTAANNTVNLGTIAACGNTINTSGVYIAGFIGDDAVLWKDGVATFLTNNNGNGNSGKSAFAVSTIVFNNDVYVLGDEEDNYAISTIKLWKNGLLTNITNGTTYADAYSFDIYNGDVYIAGVEKNSGTNSTEIPKIWKNGIATILQKDTFDNIEIGAIKVYNGDVYVTGTGFRNYPNTGNGGFRAIYWKNGVINYLSNSNIFSSQAYGLFINNGDLYITGAENTNGQNQSRSYYWKNGVKSLVSFATPHTESDILGIFVDNNNVYLSGVQIGYDANGSSYYNATYWKNNVINQLTNYNTWGGPRPQLASIFVKNNIVYTVGRLEQFSGRSAPLYFQNNVVIPLTGFTNSQDAEAYSIFVK